MTVNPNVVILPHNLYTPPVKDFNAGSPTVKAGLKASSLTGLTIRRSEYSTYVALLPFLEIV